MVSKYTAIQPLSLSHVYSTQLLLALQLVRSGFNLKEGRQAGEERGFPSQTAADAL